MPGGVPARLSPGARQRGPRAGCPTARAWHWWGLGKRESKVRGRAVGQSGADACCVCISYSRGQQVVAGTSPCGACSKPDAHCSVLRPGENCRRKESCGVHSPREKDRY